MSRSVEPPEPLGGQASAATRREVASDLVSYTGAGCHSAVLCCFGDDFLRLAVEYGDMAGEVEDSGAAAVRDAQRTIGAELRALGEAGLLCFGARRMRLLTGGGGPDADWPESHLAVVRFDDPQIASGPAPHTASG